MNKLIALILIFVFISNIAFADCDWNKGIKPLPDGTYSYSLECHVTVGKLVASDKSKDQQITDLNKAIQLKDLALTTSDQRATMWSNTSQNLEDRLQKIDQTERHNEILYIGLGILGTVLTGFMVSRLAGK